MVASIQSLESTSETGKHSIGVAAECHENSEYDKYQLVRLLQSTLDLETIIDQFLGGVNTLVRVDGLTYVEEERDLALRFGKASAHSCGYRLISGHDSFGEVTFHRSRRFSDSELEQIEGLLVLLLVPISNALKYQDAVRDAIQEPLLTINDRSKLENQLTREIELAKRHNHPLSLMLIRVESKAQRKTTKLPVRLVTELTGLIQEVCRSTDMLQRIGGKDFQLILHNDAKGTASIARRIERSVIAHFKQHHEHQLSLMFGCASLTGTDSARSLNERAKNQLL